jgi:hypothetical protein
MTIKGDHHTKETKRKISKSLRFNNKFKLKYGKKQVILDDTNNL